MADTRLLLAGLEEYHQLLDRHILELQTEYDSLLNVWSAFSSVYEGDAADQFKTGWTRTDFNFKDYIEATRKISKMLEDRISALRDANREEGGMGF